MLTNPLIGISSRVYECRQGNFTILTAFALPCLVAATAFAVDLGSLYVERRDAQGFTDLAAIAAASNIDDAERIASSTIEANNVPRVKNVTVVRGLYTADPAIPYQQRFQPGVMPYNAVRVITTKSGMTYFGRALGVVEPKIQVTALGVAKAEAAFSLGSRLAAVRDGIPNRLLGALLGGNVQLSVMDYDALLNAHIELGSFMRALATQMNITAGTYNDVLASNANVGNILSAAASVLSNGGDPAAAVAIETLLRQSSASNLAIPLKSLIDLGSLGALSIGQNDALLSSTLNVLDLVNASAAMANGKRQVQVDLTASVPGLLALKLDLAIGEPMQHSPWVRVGQAGSTLYTAQTRLRLVAHVGGSGILAGTTIRLPIALDVAYAQASLASVTCAAGSKDDANVRINVTPGIAKAWIGDLTNHSLSNLNSAPVVQPAHIVSTPLLNVTGKAVVMVGNQTPTAVEFDATDIAAKVIKRVDTSNFAQSLVSSLLGELSLTVSVAGLSLTSPTLVQNAIVSILSPVAKPIDQVVHSILTTLGVHLGEADVRVNGARCGSPKLSG